MSAIISLDTVYSVYKLLEKEVRHLELPRLKEAYLDVLIVPFQYYESDVKRLAELKQSQVDFDARQLKAKQLFEEAQEQEEQKFFVNLKAECQQASAASEKIRSEELSRQCATVIDKWNEGALVELPYTAGTDLPLEIWEIILKKLCSDLELEGVRGASVVARDIINASMACKELYAAALPALHHLGTCCPSVLAGDDKTWDRLASSPCSITRPDIYLSSMAEVKCGYHSHEIKLVQLMRYLGLRRPSRAPASLLRAVLSEKIKPDDSDFSRLCQASELITLQTDKALTSFNFRLSCMQLGCGTSEHLLEAGIITADDLQALRRAELQIAEAQRAQEAEKAEEEEEEKRKQQQWQQQRKPGDIPFWLFKIRPQKKLEDNTHKLVKARDVAQERQQRLITESLETWEGADQRREDQELNRWSYIYR